MIEEKLNNDVAKEVLTILSNCDIDFINNIPDDILKKMTDLAADSTKEYYIDKDKDLLKQNISEDSKDVIAILYFMYIADNSYKEELLNIWLKNEIESKK